MTHCERCGSCEVKRDSDALVCEECGYTRDYAPIGGLRKRTVLGEAEKIIEKNLPALKRMAEKEAKKNG